MKGENFAGNPMADLSNWAFPPEMQPNPEESRFDLEAALDSMVLLRSEVPEDAFTAGILGTERIGNGVVIRDDGLVLTIGYLITEATTLWLNTNKGTAVAGHPLAYDQASGFGLVQPLGRLGADQRRGTPPRDRLAHGPGGIGRPHRAGQHDRADRFARAHPRGHGQARPGAATGTPLARPVCDRSQRTCGGFRSRERRTGRTRRSTGGRHRDRGRERAGWRACRPVPENLEHRRSRGRSADDPGARRFRLPRQRRFSRSSGSSEEALFTLTRQPRPFESVQRMMRGHPA